MPQVLGQLPSRGPLYQSMSKQEGTRHGRFTRLIVGLGNYGARFSNTRGNVGFAVGRKLLDHCEMPPSEVHDPSDPIVRRSSNRRSDGADRTRHPYTGSSTKRLNKRQFAKNPEEHSWCTTRFQDYGGLWCDRLLLGDEGDVADQASWSARRCALLLPHTMSDFSGESVKLVLKANHHVQPSEILLVFEDPKMDLGVARIRRASGPSQDVNFSEIDHPGAVNVLEVVGAHYDRCEAMSDVSVLQVGIGGGRISGDEFTELESELMHKRLLPLSAFITALWAMSPTKAETFALRHTFAVTEPKAIAAACNVHRQEAAIWRSFQRSMLSSRDEALLASYSSGTHPWNLGKSAVTEEVSKVIEDKFPMRNRSR